MERIESIQAGRNTSVFRGTIGGSDYQKQRAISYFDPSGDFVVTKPIDPPIRKGTQVAYPAPNLPLQTVFETSQELDEKLLSPASGRPNRDSINDSFQ